MDYFSLSKLHTYIRRVISINFPEPVWVRAEIFNVVTKSGHYYIELGEKGATDEILAQGSAVMWKSQAETIGRQLNANLSNFLKAGNEIMFKAHVDFHIRYGLKLQILEINEEFALGLIAIQKLKTLQRLKDEGLWQLNKTRMFPYLIRRIALIASASSAAYADFMDQLKLNSQGYRFKIELYNVAVQGQLSVDSIVSAFRKIKKNPLKYDLIVLIRGGGSKHDLSDFDQFDISKAISICPLPVITGIGHQTDESIADLSAYLSLKTPTAVAEHILQHTAGVESSTINLVNEIQAMAGMRCHQLKFQFQSVHSDFQILSQRIIANEHLHLHKIYQNVKQYGNGILLKLKESLHRLELNVHMSDPEALFEKGYTLSTVDGKSVSKYKGLKAGQELTTHFQAGIIKSKITEVWAKEK